MRKCVSFLTVILMTSPLGLKAASSHQTSSADKSALLQDGWKSKSDAIRHKWDKLTDKDLDDIKRDSKKAAGIIQKRYNISKQKAEAEWKSFTASLEDKAIGLKDEAKDKAQEMDRYWERAKDLMKKKWDKLKDEDLEDAKEAVVKHKESLKDSTKKAAAKTGEKLASTKENVKDAAANFKNKLRHYYNYTAEEAHHKWEEFKKSLD